MLFVLMNAPTTFQALMNEVFKPLLRKYVLEFFDEILIYSKTIEEHVQHLTEVLGILRSQQPHFNYAKCCIAESKVEYLGQLFLKEAWLLTNKKSKQCLNGLPREHCENCMVS